jgi:HEPN domain-containing protein
MARSGGDEDDRTWLTRLEPEAWVRAGLAELSRTAETGDPRALVAGAKRAAGMGLNAVLGVSFRASWGRSYVEHLRAASEDPDVPPLVRERCARVLVAEPPAGPIVQLRSKRAEAELVEAVKDILAWSFGEVVKSAPPTG